MSDFLKQRVIIILVLIISFISCYRLFAVSRDQLTAPYDIGYESPQLCTIKLIQNGKNIYDRSIYERSPFTLTMYTPGYHYLAALLPQFQDNIFVTGRILAMVFMVLASFSLFLPWRPFNNLAISFAVIAILFSINTIISHTAYLRNDSMGLLFSVLAIVLAEKHDGRFWKIILIALISFLAFLSKQSYVSAAISCFIFFLLNNKKEALKFALSIIFFSIFLEIFALFYWGNGFLFCVFEAPRNPILFHIFVENWIKMLCQPLFFLFMILTLLSVIYFISTNGAVKDSPYLIYLFSSMLVMNLTLGNIGARTNYFYEPILAGLLWFVYITGKYDLVRRKINLITIILLFILGIIAYENYYTDEQKYNFASTEDQYIKKQYIRNVKREINGLMKEGDKVLNLASNILSFELQDEPIMNDPILYLTLWGNNVLSINPLIKNIVNQEFSLILTGKEIIWEGRLETSHDYMNRAIITFYEKVKAGECYYYIPKKL